MSKDSRFWRNVTLIALAHVALIAGLIRWSVEARSSSNAQSVVWLGDVGGASAATEPTTSEPPRSAKLSPSPEPRLPKSNEAEKQEPLLTVAKSEIELPIPTPTPTSTSTPKATATSTPKPKETPKPTPKSTPKKTVLAKASPKPSPKVKSSATKSADKAKQADANAEKKKIAKAASAKNGSSSQNSTGKGSSAGKSGHAGGGKSASEFGWYGNMLHDRFYSAWIQPTTTVASGTRISTLVKVRIEKDGRVSSFEIIKPSENIVVNESVAAIAKRVTQVDPVPSGLGNGDHYDVRINFELNTDQETAH
jgi:outer membrane biosynthesis protein TonB